MENKTLQYHDKCMENTHNDNMKKKTNNKKQTHIKQ